MTPRLATALTLALTLPAAGAPVPESGYGLPRDVSVDGAHIDRLIHFTLIAVTVVFVIVAAMLVYSLARHGRKHVAVYDHGSKGTVGLVVGLVALMIVAIDIPLFVTTVIDMRRYFWNFAAAERHPNVVRLEVEAHQWSWLARYPGPDQKFGTPDDVVTTNDIRIPVGAPVLVQLAAVDVIHSMNLPNFRVKRDAVPGMITKLKFEAREEGEFEIACAQHCGPNHYKMRGVLTVLSPEGYQRWLAAAEEDARRAYDPDDAEADWGWEWRTD
jgi:cytochrome c oxidase subunit 2